MKLNRIRKLEKLKRPELDHSRDILGSRSLAIPPFGAFMLLSVHNTALSSRIGVQWGNIVAAPDARPRLSRAPVR
jgi:hypothetical protein